MVAYNQDVKEYSKRLYSSIVIAGLFITSIIFSKLSFAVIMIMIAALMCREWFEITRSSLLDELVGLIFIIPACSFLALFNYESCYEIVIFFISIIWVTDSFAMIGGKTIGGLKLAPIISPKKTWSGLITGMLVSIIFSYIYNYFINLSSIHIVFDKINYMIFAVIISLMSQISDLSVSYYKRKHNVKDSGSLIPGHGGVLDRFDSFLLPTYTLISLFIYVKHYSL